MVAIQAKSHQTSRWRTEQAKSKDKRLTKLCLRLSDKDHKVCTLG